MPVYKNIKAVKSLTNASLTSIVDITNLNFNTLSSGVLEFLSNIKYDETLNTVSLNKGNYDFIDITDTISLKLDGITTFSIDSLGRAEGQELLVSVAEAQRLRLTDFNDWPDIGVPGEIIYTGIQNQKPEFGEDFIGYLQTRGWVSLTGLGQNYITLTQLAGSPPFPSIPGPNKGTLWIGAQGYETTYEAATQTVYYTDEFGNIFDILSDFVWLKDNDDAIFKLPGKVVIGEPGDAKQFQYADGNQTPGYVLTCDAQGNASWQPVNIGGGTACSYVTVQTFSADVPVTITHSLNSVNIVIQLIDMGTNERVEGYYDNYQLNSVDVTLSQDLTNIKVIVLSADCQEDAVDVNYDNSASGLSSTNVQDAIDEIVSLLPSSGYIEYKALLTQSSTSAPTDSILVNTLTGTWSYISEGIYHFTSVGSFSNPAKVEVYIPGVTVLGYTMTNSIFYIKSAARFDNDTVEVRTGFISNSAGNNYLNVDPVGGATTDVLNNDVLSYTPITIRVWS
jgi:hypothetical protein